MRRDFLELCGMAGLALPFRPTAARAAEKKDDPYNDSRRDNGVSFR
jgi:uncharacterized protein (DUF1501 family)